MPYPQNVNNPGTSKMQNDNYLTLYIKCKMISDKYLSLNVIRSISNVKQGMLLDKQMTYNAIRSEPQTRLTIAKSRPTNRGFLLSFDQSRVYPNLD